MNEHRTRLLPSTMSPSCVCIPQQEGPCHPSRIATTTTKWGFAEAWSKPVVGCREVSVAIPGLHFHFSHLTLDDFPQNEGGGMRPLPPGLFPGQRRPWCLLRALLIAGPVLSRLHREAAPKHEIWPRTFVSLSHGAALTCATTSSATSPCSSRLRTDTDACWRLPRDTNTLRLRGGAIDTANEVGRSDGEANQRGSAGSDAWNVAIQRPCFPERVLVCVLPFGTQLANGFRHLCSCFVIARHSKRQLRLGKSKVRQH